MVSFQCNACGDVCTKPKLDKHRGQCQSSFDCIDCGKRFDVPADYKGHTTCISEAEKYEKSVYNGNGKRHRNGRETYNQRSRYSNGGQNRGDTRSSWGRTVSRATGANDTPLGTPIRMSPITDIPSPSKTTNTSKSNGQETVVAAVSQATEPNPKKRKSPPEVTDQVEEVQADVELPKKKKTKQVTSDSIIPSEKPKEKKSKKDKKKEKVADLTPIPLPPSLEPSAREATVILDSEGKKEKKRQKEGQRR